MINNKKYFDFDTENINFEIINKKAGCNRLLTPIITVVRALPFINNRKLKNYFRESFAVYKFFGLTLNKTKNIPY
ncbi:MAG: hypothetical protein DRI94_10775 [Bacteroidetes bacterium]|nr:MAG: hypothetical protein DRI94_10775 [Bacteroidota bacterium]